MNLINFSKVRRLYECTLYGDYDKSQSSWEGVLNSLNKLRDKGLIQYWEQGQNCLIFDSLKRPWEEISGIITEILSGLYSESKVAVSKQYEIEVRELANAAS